jgi:hypothetical protein
MQQHQHRPASARADRDSTASPGQQHNPAPAYPPAGAPSAAPSSTSRRSFVRTLMSIASVAALSTTAPVVVSPPIASASTQDRTFATIERFRSARAAFNRLWDELDEAEGKIGDRPFAWVGWRHKETIGREGIEELRDDLLSETEDREQKRRIRSEYRRKLQEIAAAEKAVEDWYREHGLADLRSQVAIARDEYNAADRALAGAIPTTPAGLVGLLTFIRENAWDDQGPKHLWEQRSDEMMAHTRAIEASVRGMAGGELASVSTADVEALKAALDASGDAQLLDLAERYIFAEAEHEVACGEHSKLEEAWFDARGPMPKALRVRKTDAALGIQPLAPVRGAPRRKSYEFAYDVDPLRAETWPVGECDIQETADMYSISRQRAAPSPEARARADEIIAAYDEWEAKRPKVKPRAVAAADRKKDAACSRACRIEEQVADTPATSLAGLVAKARCAVALCRDGRPDPAVLSTELAASIIADLLAMQAAPETAVTPAAAA